MRLFIAINFDYETKEKIKYFQNLLRKYAKLGNFTLEENLHLTLVFLGEVEQSRIPLIKKAMDDIKETKFILSFSNMGKFKRDSGDIWWIGIEKNNTLLKLQKNLSIRLSESGFIIEKRKFTPHLTLGREVVLNDIPNKSDFNNIENISAEIGKISLMKSERINGKLTYTEIYKKDLLN